MKFNFFYSIVALSLLIGSCNTSISQKKDIEIIRETITQYNNCIIRKDLLAMTGFIYPEMFNKFSKEDMVNDATKSMHNEDYDIVVNDIFIDTISDVVMHNLSKYALAKNRTNASFRFKDDVLSDSVKQKDLYNRFCTNFKKAFGESNVKCNDSEKIIDVIMKSDIFLIYTNKHKKWFLLSDTNPEDIEKFVPIEVRNKLGFGEITNNN